MDQSGFFSNEMLPESARSGRMSHAYIVVGDETGALAALLAAAAVCSGTPPRPCKVCRDCVKAERGVHPDIIVTEAEPGREIVVDSARAIRRDASVMPNEAARKAYIIKNADMMNKAAQNAMLKLLEEPPGGAVFILDTDDPSALLDTVRSRCVELRTAPGAVGGAAEDTDGAAGLAADFIAVVIGGAYELCEFSFRLDKLDKAGLAAFLDAAEHQAVQRLKASPGQHAEKYAHTVRAIHRAREYARQNVNAGHISGLLLASLI